MSGRGPRLHTRVVERQCPALIVVARVHQLAGPSHEWLDVAPSPLAGVVGRPNVRLGRAAAPDPPQGVQLLRLDILVERLHRATGGSLLDGHFFSFLSTSWSELFDKGIPPGANPVNRGLAVGWLAVSRRLRPRPPTPTFCPTARRSRSWSWRRQSPSAPRLHY